MLKFLLKCLLPIAMSGLMIGLIAYYAPVMKLEYRYFLLIPFLLITLSAGLSLAFFVTDLFKLGFPEVKLWPCSWSLKPNRRLRSDSRSDEPAKHGLKATVIYCLCMVFFIAGILWAMIYFLRAYPRNHLAKYGVVTRAIIYDSQKTSTRNSSGNTITVRFITLDGDTRENYIVEDLNGRAIGDSVTIRYSSKRPSLCEIVEEKQEHRRQESEARRLFP